LKKFNTAGPIGGPLGVCTDLDNNIIVSTTENQLQIFSPDGTFIHKFGSSGPKVGQYAYVQSLLINQQGKLVVADRENHRVQIF